MNIKTYLILAALASPFAANAQTATIGFENTDGYTAISIYDTWRESPFRTGKLKGNIAIVDNTLEQSAAQTGIAANPTEKILAFQRSRFGSNTFGVRIDLAQPFELTPEAKYVHVYLHKPLDGRVMLIGLGKRTDRPGQSPDVEQFWQLSSQPVASGKWNDAVFPVKGAGGILIHSLVVVPDCESPHRLTEDFAVYIDEIIVNATPEPRILPNNAFAPDGYVQKTADDGFCYVNNANRNGEVLAADGSPLNNYKAPSGKPFTVIANPANGFTYEGIRIRYSGNLSGDVVFPANLFKNNRFTIPAEYMTGEMEIEGLFVELKK